MSRLGATYREGFDKMVRGLEVLPLRNKDAEKLLAMLKAGHNKFWSSFNTGA